MDIQLKVGGAEVRKVARASLICSGSMPLSNWPTSSVVVVLPKVMREKVR